MQWFKTRELKGKREVFDPLRKKYVSLTPEEEVRQLTLHHLIEELNYPAGLIAVEYSLRLHELVKRCDIVVFSPETKPVMIVECKSRHMTINQAVLDQATRYNISLQVKYLLLTNGLNQYIILISDESYPYTFLDSIPDYQTLLNEKN